MSSIRFSVQSWPQSRDAWLSFARRAEAGGFEALLVPDHPGNGPTPWPALGAAAAVTSTLKLGTYVLQTGLRDPIQAAADAATLDVLAPGRVRLGLGAGHTFQEWGALGAERPPGRDRAGRLIEFVDAVSGLLAGQTVNLEGTYLHLVDARLDELPVEGPVQLVVGGSHPRILAAAARHADVVALSGLGRTLSDGHRHEIRWTDNALDAQLDVVHRAAAGAAKSPKVEVLVQSVTLTDDRARALQELSGRLPGVSVADLETTPFVLIGTLGQMEEQVLRHAQERGITHYAVREPDVPVIEQLILKLSQSSS